MDIRKTQSADLDRIMSIYEKAKLYMAANGNPTQWTDGYPARALIETDIRSGKSYVCVDDEGSIVATFYFEVGVESTYLKIFDGNWLNDREYGVIHRIAVDGHRKGIATFCLDWCFGKCGNIRIDTHRNNRPMRNALERNGFSYCGIIHLFDGDERIAFQRSE